MEMNVQTSKTLACVMSGLASGDGESISRINSVTKELYFGSSGMR